MRIFIRRRAENAIKNDQRISKFYYGSRSNYSIENAILEKQLMYNLVIRDRNEIMYNISDLEAYYNRQLPNIGCLVEESVGVEKEPAMLFAKILPVMEHHICTSYRISKDLYGSKTYKLGGTDQVNSVLGSICRDTSCIIFKKLEDQKLGVKMYYLISQ